MGIKFCIHKKCREKARSVKDVRSKVIMTQRTDEASFDSNPASDDYDDYICGAD